MSGLFNTKYYRQCREIAILIENKVTNRKYIIDTKWKRPGYSASIQDLRQVYAYARFWDAENVMLLYPGDRRQNQCREFDTKDVVGEGEELIAHQGFLRFVEVVKDGLLSDGVGEEVLDGFIGE